MCTVFDQVSLSSKTFRALRRGPEHVHLEQTAAMRCAWDSREGVGAAYRCKLCELCKRSSFTSSLVQPSGSTPSAI